MNWHQFYSGTDLDALVPAGHDAFFVVMFSRTNSFAYPEAVEVAHRASNYRELVEGKRVRHCAVFDESPEQVRVAMRLTQLTRDWKGTMYFARGRLVAPYGGWSVLEVLTCLSTAQRCIDWKAHCLSVVENLEPLDVFSHLQLPERPAVLGRYLFPCAQLKMYFSLDRGPLSSLTDRVQAKAIDRNVDWCPYFDLRHFRPLDGELTVSA